MENWILRRIRRTGANTLGAWGVAFLAIGLAVLLSWRYWDNFLHGPFEIAPPELGTVQDISKAPRYFVRVKGTKIQDAGFVRLSVLTENGVETGRSVSEFFYALTVADKLLIVESPGVLGPADLVLQGVLKRIPADLDKRLFDFPDSHEIRRHFYPFYLVELAPVDFREAGSVAIFVLVLFVAVFLRFALPALRRLIDPASHPAAKRAASWGLLDIVGPDVERELRSPRVIIRGGWTLTDSFVVQKDSFAFDLFRFSDLLWAYKRVSVQRINFIPVWTSCCADLIGRGGSAFIKTDQAMVNAILEFATRRAPWAYFGYSEQVRTRILKDKEGFCREVDERKRNMTTC